jgi:hypothetical protein
MAPQAPSQPRQRAHHEPLFDILPLTGASIEVFYADRALETFGRCGGGWFWWFRRCGFSPDGVATGPFATSYAAYRHAMLAAIPLLNAWGTDDRFHVPNVGHGRADTGCYGVRKPRIYQHLLN